MDSKPIFVKASVIWLALVALTLLSIEFPATIAGGDGHKLQLGAIVILCFIKVLIIGWKFMELDHAPVLFQAGLLLWVVGIGGAILLFAI